MCRFVILTVIAASLVSCVLADPGPPTNSTETTPTTPTTPTPSTANTTKCANTPELQEKKQQLVDCFNSTVQYHLNSSATLKNETCKNVTVFGQKLDAYFADLIKSCNISSINLNTTNFIKLVEYSLSNNSFKTFYENITCLKSVEWNISNSCVRDKLGFFNISKTEKHVKWYLRGQLKFNENTCWKSKQVRDCVTVNLKQCPVTTTSYVSSLFQYARNLENCSQYPDPVLPSSQNGTETTTWLTTPVIATLSVGAVVVIGAIVVIVIKKK